MLNFVEVCGGPEKLARHGAVLHEVARNLVVAGVPRVMTRADLARLTIDGAERLPDVPGLREAWCGWHLERFDGWMNTPLPIEN